MSDRVLNTSLAYAVFHLTHMPPGVQYHNRSSTRKKKKKDTNPKKFRAFFNDFENVMEDFRFTQSYSHSDRKGHERKSKVSLEIYKLVPKNCYSIKNIILCFC